VIYSVAEIFSSIQGEGFFVGTPANFVRLAGCPVHCSFCDTDKDEKAQLDEFQIYEQIDPRVDVVVITGGEPAVQRLDPLCKLLRKRGHLVHIETSGIEPLDTATVDWVAVSPKPDWPLKVGRVDEVKWLIPSWSIDGIRPSLGRHKYLQPVNDFKTINESNLRLCLGLLRTTFPTFKLSVQLHKLIGVR